MRYKLKCSQCGAITSVDGTWQPSTGETVLDQNAIDLSEACDHILDGGAYEVLAEESNERDDYEGDGVFADNH
jgi:hypothetical protein